MGPSGSTLVHMMPLRTGRTHCRWATGIWMMKLPGHLRAKVRMIDGSAGLGDSPLFNLHASYLLDIGSL